jgi:hypothetical protein
MAFPRRAGPLRRVFQRQRRARLFLRSGKLRLFFEDELSHWVANEKSDAVAVSRPDQRALASRLLVSSPRSWRQGLASQVQKARLGRASWNQIGSRFIFLDEA